MDAMFVTAARAASEVANRVRENAYGAAGTTTSGRVEAGRVELRPVVEAREEVVGGLEEADPLGAVVHRHDPARAEPLGDLRRLGAADRRPVAHRDDQQVD